MNGRPMPRLPALSGALVLLVLAAAAPERQRAVDEERTPVVLVHGINGSPRDFADLLPRLNRERYQPVYAFYPSGMALDDAARQLAMRLRELVRRHKVARLAVVAHSLGGQVSTGMLDTVDVADELPGWRALVTISAPFAGVDT